MTRTIAAKTTTIALASLLTLAMLAGTNALAGHQYRVAAAAQPVAVAVEVQRVTIVGQRNL